MTPSPRPAAAFYWLNLRGDVVHRSDCGRTPPVPSVWADADGKDDGWVVAQAAREDGLRPCSSCLPAGGAP